MTNGYISTEVLKHQQPPSYIAMHRAFEMDK